MVNENTLKLIKGFEKLKLSAYHGEADQPGIYTIGWGHVITGHEELTHGIDLFKPNQLMWDVKITKEQAETLLQHDISKAQKGVQLSLNSGVWNLLTSDQQGAVVSLVFNIGSGGFKESRVRVSLNSGAPGLAYAFFKSWISSNGKRQNGLIRRRAAEVALYKSDYPMLDYFLSGSSIGVINKAKKYIGVEDE